MHNLMIYQELLNSVGTERVPQMSDRHNLSYLEATINESMRFCNLAFHVPHLASNDIVLNDFFIPKGTIIIPNQVSLFIVKQLKTSAKSSLLVYRRS